MKRFFRMYQQTKKLRSLLCLRTGRWLELGYGNLSRNKSSDNLSLQLLVTCRTAVKMRRIVSKSEGCEVNHPVWVRHIVTIDSLASLTSPSASDFTPLSVMFVF